MYTWSIAFWRVMEITKLWVAGALFGLSALVACRGSNSGTAVDAASDTGEGRIRIQDIQSDKMAPGTAVAVSGVIVTAIDSFGNRKNDIWVEEPGGGALSGVHVFGVPVDQVGALAVGDVVTITGGVKQEFMVGSRSVTEIGAPRGSALKVVKTGTAAVPASELVDALAIGQKATVAERNAEWEKWEGVLITLANVTQFEEATVVSGSNPDPTLQSIRITGGMLLESGLTAFPSSGLGVDVCFASATGVLDDIGAYFVLPRTAADLVLGGTACPPAESSAELCADGIDNDGSGFKDCDDNRCIVGASACRAVATIPGIQGATPMGGVELQHVWVTAVTANKKSFWASTDLAAAANNGVFVFRASGTPDLDPAVVPGAKVSVIGKVIEFNDDKLGATLTELLPLQITVDPDSPTTPVPPTPLPDPTVAALLVPAAAAAHESVLVTLSDVAITAIGADANGKIATGKQNGTTFGLSTDGIPLATADLKCYASITGVWTSLQAPSSAAATKPNAYGFVPLALGAIGTACN
jgi:hypothetical protein